MKLEMLYKKISWWQKFALLCVRGAFEEQDRKQLQRLDGSSASLSPVRSPWDKEHWLLWPLRTPMPVSSRIKSEQQRNPDKRELTKTDEGKM